MPETPEDAALIEAMMTARHGSEDWRKNPSWVVESQRGTMAHVLAVVRSHDRAAARARLDALGAAYDAAPGVAETDSTALVEAMLDVWFEAATITGDDASRLSTMRTRMTAVLGVARSHDAPTIATLTASLAEAEARAGRAEAAVERLRAIGLDIVGTYHCSAFGTFREDEPGYGPIKAMASELGLKSRRDLTAALKEPPHGR